MRFPAPALKTQAEWNETFSSIPWMDTYTARHEYIQEHAWSILTKESAHALGKFLSLFNLVIEPFAGTGYMASHLREVSGLGRKYRAYDGCVSHFGSKRKNYGFTKSGCFNVNLKKADCIVMSWPNYASNIAYRIARKMVPGQYLVYQGEGNYGCTGDDQFHDYLDTHFRRLTLRERMINHGHTYWQGMHDQWYVYIKKTEEEVWSD